MKLLFPALISGVCILASCGNSNKTAAGDSAAADTTPGDSLPAPFATESVKNFSKVIGWKDEQKPVAPEGFTVTKFADGFDNPRWLYILENGDILVAESATKPKVTEKVAAAVSGKSKSQNMGSADRITLLRDSNGDGQPDSRNTFISGLNQPFGMLVLNNQFYVANTDGIMVYPYTANANTVSGAGKKILELPAGGYNNHWTRNLLAAKDGKHIYVSVGSGSNVAEHGMENEVRRANILEINPDGTGERVFAAGLRNPVGMDWAPGTNTLWTAVNERDELGDELVPDYMTSVKDGGFYGWPYAYFGQHADPRMKGEGKDLVARTIVPDVPLGSHTASLGLAFYTGDVFPDKYRNGAFVGQHGSWNRSQLSGYKVVFVPFSDGKPSGAPEDFLTGFIADAGKSEVYGRPVGVAVAKDGSLLVADDAANTIWRITYTK